MKIKCPEWLFLFIIVAILYSCKKSQDNSNYLNCQISGKTYSFDSLVAINQPGPPAIVIRGYSKTQGNIEILLSDALPGIYNSYELGSPPNSNKTIFEFTINALVQPYMGGYITEQLLLPGNTIQNRIYLNVTEINNNFIGGTFSGNLMGPVAIVPISNGTFRIHF